MKRQATEKKKDNSSKGGDKNIIQHVKSKSMSLSKDSTYRNVLESLYKKDSLDRSHTDALSSDASVINPTRSWDLFNTPESMILHETKIEPFDGLPHSSSHKKLYSLSPEGKAGIGATDNQKLSSVEFAKRLKEKDGFTAPEDICRILAENLPYNRSTAVEYFKLYDYTGKDIDDALREFLENFVLFGETQERSRILEYFANRYHECNPDFAKADACYSLTFAIVLLNTDLYTASNPTKMTMSEFANNVNSCDDIQFPEAVLNKIYTNIKRKEIKVQSPSFFSYPCRRTLTNSQSHSVNSGGDNVLHLESENSVNNQRPKMKIQKSNSATGVMYGSIVSKYSVSSASVSPRQGKKANLRGFLTFRPSNKGKYTANFNPSGNSDCASSEHLGRQNKAHKFNSLPYVKSTKPNVSYSDYTDMMENTWVKAKLPDLDSSFLFPRKHWHGYRITLNKSRLLLSRGSMKGTCDHIAIPLNHSFSKIHTTPKRKHCVLLIDYKGVEVFFQFLDIEECENWIIKLNTAAALYSLRPLPRPLSSPQVISYVFQRPILCIFDAEPNPKEQIKLWNKQAYTFKKELPSFEDDKSKYLEKNAKKYWEDCTAYFEYEIERYQYYADALEDIKESIMEEITSSADNETKE